MKKPKRYPMDGPSLETQRLILAGPRKNRLAIIAGLAAREVKRPETLEILNLK
jgi:hypothetical protein